LFLIVNSGSVKVDYMESVDRPTAVSEPGTQARATNATHGAILEAARQRVLDGGIARLSTRSVADAAGVPLSQLHYHFGSKRQLILDVLEAENVRRLSRQSEMYGEERPLWQRYEQACDFLEDDLDSGYVRVLQEMIAAGWSDPILAASVREQVLGWFRLLADVARHEEARLGSLGPFTPDEVAALMGMPFMGAESSILLGIAEEDLPTRSALRKIGVVLRGLETRGVD
jgi:AcrR family transcriptional regulator